MQVMSVSKWISGCYADHTVENTFLAAQPMQLVFFPRVRTPCGHGAQVIVEGREEQSDGGEKNKNTQYNPNQTTKTKHYNPGPTG